MKRAAGILIMMFGACLLTLNTHGLIRGVRHPDLRVFDGGEISAGRLQEIGLQRLMNPSSAGVRMTRGEALAAYEAAKKLPDEEQRLREIQRIVTESTVHYYPIGRKGTHFAMSASENFVLWTVALFSPLLERFGLAALDPYEFLDGAKNWERGAGLCGQFASIVVHLSREAGLTAGKAGLDGHVVAVARTSEGREFVLDPDFGFTLQGPLSRVAREPERVVQAVLARGHRTREAAEKLAAFYGPEGNVLFWDGDWGYRPLGYMLERGAYVAKWAMPVMLILLGLVLWRSARRPLRGTIQGRLRRHDVGGDAHAGQHDP